MDILSEIGKSRLYTLHSHTQFCDGRAPMEEMARAAVAEGFDLYGFSPHSPIPIDSPCNMSAGSVADYLSEVRRIRGLLGPVCSFFAGMEIDYLGPEWGPANDYFRRLPLDFRIGSVHFIPSQEGVPTDIDGHFDSFSRKMTEIFHGDIRYVVDTFFSHSLDMIEAGGFDIIGHFDKIGHNASLYAPGIEDEPFYRARISDMVDAIAASGLIIELNTKAFREHGRMFPSVRPLREIVRRGVPVIVNSDAHRPDAVNAGRLQGFAILDRLMEECRP